MALPEAQDDPRLPGPGVAETTEPALVAVVDAPTALTGFLLSLRLPRYRCRNAQDAEGRWRVTIQLRSADALPALLELIERWRASERIGVTHVRVGEVVHRLPATGQATGPLLHRVPV